MFKNNHLKQYGGDSPQLHHIQKAQLFSVGLFLSKNSMVTSTYAKCLLTIQEATFNEINNLRGGGLQVKTGRWSRQRTENGHLKNELASERPPNFGLTATVMQVRIH